MKKKLLCVFLSLLTTSTLWAADGDTFTANTVEGVEMTFMVISESDKTCQVGDGWNKSISQDIEGSITIPSEANGYQVKEIGFHAFYRFSGITSITIPESVTNIQGYAFMECTGLTSITIPNGVTSIKNGIFRGCSGLTSISIPEGLTSIGIQAFYYCSALTNITIPESVTNIGATAFNGCESLTNITIPVGVTSISDDVFCDCSSLTCITIPEGITNIGESAFQNCSGLTSITIPEGVINIGDRAFYDCSGLTSITIPEGVTSIGDNVFFGCTGLTSITIPEGVTNIGNDAFSGCSGLTSVTIPGSVTSIGNSAFGACSGLTSVTIPGSVTNIGNNAFAACSDLTCVTIPESVTNIGNFAFSWCDNLNFAVVLNEDPESMTIGSYVWNSIKEMLYVPQGTKEGYTSLWGDQFEKIIELADADVTLGKNVVSFASEQMLDFSTPIDDLKAYIVSGISSDGKAIINEVTGAVPSGTGLILKGTAGHSYTIPYTTTVPAAVSNMLVGVTEDTEIGGNDLDYILSDGKFVKASYGTLPAGKAYLKLDEALARSVITIGDEITGIKTIDGAPIAAERYYNLNGQRVSTPQKGLYIVNGKKVAKK